MRKITVLILIMLFAAALSANTNFKLRKNLTVEKESHYSENLVSLGGRIEVKGVVEQSIFMIGGELIVDGQVNQDVICFATDVRIGKNAWIKGELLLIGGNLDRDVLSRVNGEFFYFRFDLKKIESTLIPIISDSKTITFLRILKIVFWFILTLLVLAIIPRKIVQANEMFDRNVLRVGVIGLISMFAFIFLLIVSIVLIFLIVGIPLMMLLILLYFAVLILGRTVMFYFIGSKISGALGLRNISAALFLLIGIIFYTLLKFLPVIGPVILAVMSIFELGIGCAFILRKRLTLKN